MTAEVEDATELSYRGRSVRFDRTPVSGLAHPGVIYASLEGGRFYEQPFLEYIASLELSGVYVDAGSCIGTHAVYFALFCPSTEVVAFEPRGYLCERVRTNVALNDLDGKVTVHDVGLSDRTETVTARLDRVDVVIECRRLDDVVPGGVDVLKIDVEGMEPRVIDGAARILAQSRPRIFAEAGQREQYRALVRTLARHGYRPTGRVFNSTPTYEFVHAPWKARVFRSRAALGHHRRRARAWLAGLRQADEHHPGQDARDTEPLDRS